MHALPDHALARLQALGQRDRAGVVAQHLHAAQFSVSSCGLTADGGVLAVMEQRGGRQQVAAPLALALLKLMLPPSCQADLGLGIFQRELGAVGAALRVGGGRDLAQHGVEVWPGSGPSVTLARWPTAGLASRLSGTSQMASMSPDQARL